ncbi:hypothetical protein BCR37DRAFT_224923 [Protomyces lactucae-debilis]|uniref:Uncharacterized protein n=1 Tax=Protomyces lactucae-debilis TaxID=2754530 RepID=A0A1Y2ER81_PROLT|nr:uncharacterized protein BCR37DRAFT_224923 [Protomyces lactucae-debilis]ORY74103.1 hypothetical protein BCR37DRAFT_224923 [Protomyces lactucae-debilis]
MPSLVHQGPLLAPRCADLYRCDHYPQVRTFPISALPNAPSRDQCWLYRALSQTLFRDGRRPRSPYASVAASTAVGLPQAPTVLFMAASSLIQSNSSGLHVSSATDTLGLSSLRTDQQRDDVSSSVAVALGSHVEASSSGTGLSHLILQAQNVQPVASTGRDTPVSNDAQASQSLKRPLTALSKPFTATASPSRLPKKQKMGRAKHSGHSTDLQSPPLANLSIVEAVSGHGSPAKKALPDDHVNVETGQKISSQHEPSHASHDGQRIARLEIELEQMHERLATILFEQSNKHQAEMEQFEGRLSRLYQLQLEGMEARLEARYPEFQNGKESEVDAEWNEQGYSRGWPLTGTHTDCNNGRPCPRACNLQEEYFSPQRTCKGA